MSGVKLSAFQQSKKAKRQQSLFQKPTHIRRFSVRSARIEMFVIAGSAFDDLTHDRRNAADIAVFIEVRRGEQNFHFLFSIREMVR
jgi:hypothetical protein